MVDYDALLARRCPPHDSWPRSTSWPAGAGATRSAPGRTLEGLVLPAHRAGGHSGGVQRDRRHGARRSWPDRPGPSSSADAGRHSRVDRLATGTSPVTCRDYPAAVPPDARGRVRRPTIVLTAGNTLAASLIWGINTIFLLDAGLSNFEAFAANAFYTAGMVLFEIPTGIVADSRGRRTSFLLGTLSLAGATGALCAALAAAAAFVWWAIVSALLGLGLHLLLRRHRGLAGRRADRHRVRPVSWRRSSRAARWSAGSCMLLGLGSRWLPGPADQSRRALSGPRGDPGGDVRGRHDPDARPGLHPRARQRPLAPRSRRSSATR